MAIEIDLEKAYDRVRWDFVEASLNAVLWNGEPTQASKGYSTRLPFATISILCMEWLGHSFHGSIFAREWNPIHLWRTGPSLSHLFFADDLVNARKTNVFFSSGVNIPLRNDIKDILRFQEVNDLGHYLGAPLLHKRITKSTLKFLVERVRSWLSSWDAKLLSFEGRVTLTQSVLLSIPSYLMQSTLVPKGNCDSIEGLARQFIWGATEGKRNMALVGWDDICQPKIHGGLDFHHLGDQNNAFMMKIGYNLIIKTEALRVQVFRAKYGVSESM
ncbi:hypothetical protein PVK06_016867 [Gossypium arboreum]|uniref:Reverse transcriptase n=1 Tax=Gossypium arboreum TaxID=29729 RepID=A0ABR0Q1M9_GOSAR|nr:hypothetical protein PVK06_016867 [Gossypium arboreum]